MLKSLRFMIFGVPALLIACGPLDEGSELAGEVTNGPKTYYINHAVEKTNCLWFKPSTITDHRVSPPLKTEVNVAVSQSCFFLAYKPNVTVKPAYSTTFWDEKNNASLMFQLEGGKCLTFRGAGRFGDASFQQCSNDKNSVQFLLQHWSVTSNGADLWRISTRGALVLREPNAAELCMESDASERVTLKPCTAQSFMWKFRKPFR